MAEEKEDTRINYKVSNSGEWVPMTMLSNTMTTEEKADV